MRSTPSRSAPLNKAALASRRVLNSPGHTEILAEECGVNDFAMMLYLPPGEPLRGPYRVARMYDAAYVDPKRSRPAEHFSYLRDDSTRQIRFSEADLLSNRRGSASAHSIHTLVKKDFSATRNRSLIAPAVEAARQQASGCDRRHRTNPGRFAPWLRRAVHGEFDGVAAMYHDQGHIALKLIGFERAVNVTLGLPIVRTSPSHGTAFDIALGRARLRARKDLSKRFATAGAAGSFERTADCAICSQRVPDIADESTMSHPGGLEGVCLTVAIQVKIAHCVRRVVWPS